MQKITPFLWFDNQAEEAMNFYTSIFKNSKKGKIVRYGEAGRRPAGTRPHRLVRARRAGVHGPERRTAFQVHRGDLAFSPLRDAGGSRLLLGQAHPKAAESRRNAAG